MDPEKIKNDFPIFRTRSDGQPGKPLVYLDSAATSQRPQCVLDAMDEFHTQYNANVHRGIYRISEEASERFEQARVNVRDFIHAPSEREIVFTKNATEAINLAMRGWGEKYIHAGDRIVVSILEHHSNFVPWQQLARKKKARLEILDITAEGELNEDELEKISGAKLVAITHVSNVLGTVNPIEKISRLAHERGAVVFVDAAQSVPHLPVDVRRLGCDFLAFSGHKMLGPTGSGVLYGKAALLEAMDPFLYGGDMISEVHAGESQWSELPFKFEAGTPAAASVIGLGAAIGYLNKIGMDAVHRHEKEITRYALEKLGGIRGVRIYGPRDPQTRGAVIPFTIDGVHPHDIASILDSDNIAIRSGHHCAMPLHERLGLPASSRASFYVYNGKRDVDALCRGIEKAKKTFGVA